MASVPEPPAHQFAVVVDVDAFREAFCNGIHVLVVVVLAEEEGVFFFAKVLELINGAEQRFGRPDVGMRAVITIVDPALSHEESFAHPVRLAEPYFFLELFERKNDLGLILERLDVVGHAGEMVLVIPPELPREGLVEGKIFSAFQILQRGERLHLFC